MELLKRAGVELSGKRAVVVGRSNIVGTPAALLLQGQDATVTVVRCRCPLLHPRPLPLPFPLSCAFPTPNPALDRTDD